MKTAFWATNIYLCPVVDLDFFFFFFLSVSLLDDKYFFKYSFWLSFADIFIDVLQLLELDCKINKIWKNLTISSQTAL